MDTIAAAKKLISMGVLSVDSEGRVWKTATLNRYGTITIILPKRAERKISKYLTIKFNVDGQQYMVNAHRLVWEVLKGPIPDGLEVNHKDAVKTNNHPMNLELTTHGGNVQHAWDMGLNTRSPAIPEPILDQYITPAKELREKGLSFSKIAKELGISQTTAFRAVRSK